MANTFKPARSMLVPLNGADGASGSVTLTKPFPARRIRLRTPMAEVALTALPFQVFAVAVALLLAWALP
jgi:hypothetical protein